MINLTSRTIQIQNLIFIIVRILISSLFVMCISCLGIKKEAPIEITDQIKFCYDGEDKGLSKQIETNGYYISPEWNKFRYPCMFYDNGICIYDIIPAGIKAGKSSFDDLHLYFSKINKKPKSIAGEYFYHYSVWGSYSISNDTINIQCIIKPKTSYSKYHWSFIIRSYKILNKTSIQRIKLDDKDVNEYPIMHFIPVKERPPSSDAWLIDKEWFKCK